MEKVMSPATRWSWVEVNLAALRRNTQAFRRALGRGTQMMCVVKADAYGHGAVPCAKTMHAAGANQFAVATVNEGVALREAGLADAEFRTLELEGGYWVAEFTADELWYTCYIDAVTGEIPGLTFSPVPVETYPNGVCTQMPAACSTISFQELMGRRSA